jgi:oligopeptide/dipeptide ABC transporter ATP-binding protein
MSTSAQPLLSIRDLTVRFGGDTAVSGVSLDIRPGERYALVGESGSGKTVTALSVLQLNQSAQYGGSITFYDAEVRKPIDLLSYSEREMRRVRGRQIAMIFQEPMTALNALYTVGNQIVESIQLHEGASYRFAAQRAVELLERTGVPEPQRRFHSYPHELSGGQRQRAMIAMALACRPRLLIADEPTTALDVTIQAQILDLMRRLQAEFGSAILMITHNLGVINEMADRIAVMYMGKIVEIADRRTLLTQPAHPYSVGLLQSVPKMGATSKQRLAPVPGTVPDPFSIPQGCAFFPRCPARKQAACTDPAGVPLIEVEPGHLVRCTLYS